jgi:hypothetical protein
MRDLVRLIVWTVVDRIRSRVIEPSSSLTRFFSLIASARLNRGAV